MERILARFKSSCPDSENQQFVATICGEPFLFVCNGLRRLRRLAG